MLLAASKGARTSPRRCNASFERMLARYREVQATMPELAAETEAEAGLSAAQAGLIRVRTGGSRRRGSAAGRMNADALLPCRRIDHAETKRVPKPQSRHSELSTMMTYPP